MIYTQYLHDTFIRKMWQTGQLWDK